MHSDETPTRTRRHRGRDVEGILLPVTIACASVAANLRLYTPGWGVAFVMTTVTCLAEIVVASVRDHGYGRFDNFLSGQSSGVSCTALVAIIVLWHHPHASHWGVILATLGASVLAAACYSVAAWLRRQHDDT